MSRNGKVIVAMSGGVDSSVAACLLHEAGYECVGVFVRVGAHASEDDSCASTPTATPLDPAIGAGAAPAARRRRLRHGCCSATDAQDARSVAGRLGIPFYALNFERDFDRIVDYFVDEYARARTPNPCVMCNIHVKFGRLLRYADLMDAEFIATGHYARIVRRDGSPDGARSAAECGAAPAGAQRLLARARHHAKDQSYVLFGIRREHLPRCLFPLGEFADKAEVRRIAARLGLRVHDKPDSQEICFVPDHDYRRLLRERRPHALRPGELRHADGRVLGMHDGVAGFTIGQRRGLGLALGEPVYVTRLDVLNNTVTLGPRQDLLATGLIADDVNWLIDPPAGPVRGAAKIRHMHAPAAATLRPLGEGSFELHFDEPQFAVTPGQASVFYAGDVVLGGGWIRAAAHDKQRPQPASQVTSL